MDCPSCGQPVAAGARFCAHCGAALPRVCAACGHANSADSRFCGQCGRSLDETSAPAAPPPPAALACPRCRAVNQPDSVYCYACGLPLEENRRASAAGWTLAQRIPAFAQGQPGGFWVRLVAALIDGIIAGAAFSLLWFLVAGQSPGDYWNQQEFSGGDWFSFLVDLVYHSVGVGVWATTLGKKAFGLYVLRTDGSKPSFMRAIARALAVYLSAFLLGIGFLMIAFRSDKRGLHDLICDTVVVRRGTSP